MYAVLAELPMLGKQPCKLETDGYYPELQIETERRKTTRPIYQNLELTRSPFHA